jgi:hypothetical protein
VVLGLASRLELPVIFVVLPAVKGAKRDGMENLGRRPLSGASFLVMETPWRCTGWAGVVGEDSRRRWPGAD